MKKLLVISSAPLIYKNGKYFAYSPYEMEMQIWAKYSKEVVFCCPVWYSDRGLLNSEINFEINTVFVLKDFNLKSFKMVVLAIFNSFINCFVLFKAIRQSDHIHLRCPGNMSLLGSIIQIFFPRKIKTAKYAGNWDPKSKQPWSYVLQKKILSNTFLTRNIKVLVYGEWEEQTKNIYPFFTATYREIDKKFVGEKSFDKGIRFLFVGTLSEGKRPIYAVKIVEELAKVGLDVMLDIIGEGKERKELEKYIHSKKIEKKIRILGNQTKEVVELAYQNSHYVILPSKSEGWPKVIAEAMFWGCVPIATRISCIPYILDEGRRGVLLTLKTVEDILAIKKNIENEKLYKEMVYEGMNWSRLYTIDRFEEEIKKMLK